MSDLNEIERRLSAWQPDRSGLDGDALLFAAGRASAPRSRGWPIVAAFLGLVAVILGARLSDERAGRLELLAKLSPVVPPERPTESTPLSLPESSYLAALRSLRTDPEAWLARAMPSGSSLTGDPTIHVGQRDAIEP